MPEFHYTVDGEPQETDNYTMTPIQIMKQDSIDPSKYYLVQYEGSEKISYKDDPNKEIHMHNAMVFITIELAPPKPLS